MRFAVVVPNFGDFADPRVLADLAGRAEEAGATWWAGALRDDPSVLAPVPQRTDQGPPQLP